MGSRSLLLLCVIRMNKPLVICMTIIQELYMGYLPDLGNTELGNDVLQEAFINIWRRIETYDENKGRLFTWMLNIARNAAIDKVRSKGNQQTQRQVAIPNNDSLPLSVSPRVDDFGLKKIILKLKDEQRQLIDLSYFQGFTHEQMLRNWICH